MLAVVAGPALAEAPAAPPAWPEPLSLEYVLDQVGQGHPDLRLAEAALARARAVREEAASGYGLTSSLLARLRWVEPSPIAYDQSHDDHRLSLVVRKRLYDFGRTAAREAAADADVAAREQRYRDTLNRYRIAVMAAFFDVLLADLENARDMEAMSIGFVTFDRAKSRNELGQLSDIELLELETAYQVTRARQIASGTRQRLRRERLANLLDRPGQLPTELVPPRLAIVAEPIPEVDAWFSGAEAANPDLIAMQSEVQAARQRLQQAEAGDRPTLDGALELSSYTREGGSYDRWRAGVSLEVPLLTGGVTKAQVALGRADLWAAQARLAQRRLEIREAVLETWSELQSLAAKRQELAVLADYRDLYLDRSRALYELEVKTDLGDAMTQTSDVRLQRARVDYQTALAWARIQALLGQTVNLNKEIQP